MRNPFNECFRCKDFNLFSIFVLFTLVIYIANVTFISRNADVFRERMFIMLAFKKSFILYNLLMFCHCSLRQKLHTKLDVNLLQSH